MILLEQMVIFFIIISIGFLCGKKKFFSDEGIEVITFIVVNIANPALIIGAGLEKSALSLWQIGRTFLFALAFYLVLIGVAIPVSRLFATDDGERGLFKSMLIFSNIGFMGMPLLSASYGSEALIYAAIFNFIYDFLIYTYGVRILKGKKNGSGDSSKEILQVINAGTVACVIALIAYVFQIPVPGFLKTTVGYFGNLTAPLSMMVIGYSLSKIAFWELFGDKKLILFSLLKQLVIPVAGVLFVKSLISDQLLIRVCFVMLATPIGSMVAMFSQDSDNAKLPVKGVALTTIMTVVTIPLLGVLLK